MAFPTASPHVRFPRPLASNALIMPDRCSGRSDKEATVPARNEDMERRRDSVPHLRRPPGEPPVGDRGRPPRREPPPRRRDTGEKADTNGLCPSDQPVSPRGRPQRRDRSSWQPVATGANMETQWPSDGTPGPVTRSWRSGDMEPLRPRSERLWRCSPMRGSKPLRGLHHRVESRPL